MPALTQDRAKALIGRRHPEFVEFEMRWRFLADALEGGNRYRFASYGLDPRGGALFTVHNLFRHKREVPPPKRNYEPAALNSNLPDPQWAGQDPYGLAADDPFNQRRARTPVPRFTAQTIEAYLSLIYEREIKRSAPDRALEAWWLDCDGRGTTIDDWIRDEVAPLALVLGQIDLCFDHPAPPPGELVASQADVDRLGLSKCVAGYILPENVPWWRLRPDGGYAEVLVREHWETAEGTCHLYRHWTADGSVLYDPDGRVVRLGDDGMPLRPDQPGGVEQVHPHAFGRVPIVRWFYRRKARCRNVGQSAFEGIAEKEREFYNQDSETILSNTLQAHAVLMVPESIITQNGDLNVGPDWTLPIPVDPTAGPIKAEYLTTPKDGPKFLEVTKAGLVDLMDREAARTKPAGSAAGGGNGSGTVSQSGVSKAMDQRDGNAVLCKVGKALQRLEMTACKFARLVLSDGKVKLDDPSHGEVKVQYPAGYNLQSADEMLALGQQLQAFLDACGDLPEFDEEFIKAALRSILPGLDDEEYAEMDAQVEAFVERKAKQKEEAAEMAPALPGTRLPGPQPALPGPAGEEADDDAAE